MTAKTVLELLEQKAPFATAESWDNPGLLVGDPDASVTAVVVALDVTDAVIDYAVEQHAELIVTHHPVIFDPLKTVLSDSLVYRLAQAGLTVISAHTNADKAADGVNDRLCARLGLTDVQVAPDGMSRTGVLPAAMTADAFAAYVAGVLNTAVRVKAGEDLVRTVALCGGGGAELVLPLLNRVDAALTGEVKHHEWLSVPAAKTLVDGGHYATEIAVVEAFAEWIGQACSQLRVLVFEGDAPYYTIEV